MLVGSEVVGLEKKNRGHAHEMISYVPERIVRV